MLTSLAVRRSAPYRSPLPSGDTCSRASTGRKIRSRFRICCSRAEPRRKTPRTSHAGAWSAPPAATGFPSRKATSAGTRRLASAACSTAEPTRQPSRDDPPPLPATSPIEGERRHEAAPCPASAKFSGWNKRDLPTQALTNALASHGISIPAATAGAQPHQNTLLCIYRCTARAHQRRFVEPPGANALGAIWRVWRARPGLGDQQHAEAVQALCLQASHITAPLPRQPAPRCKTRPHRFPGFMRI